MCPNIRVRYCDKMRIVTYRCRDGVQIRNPGMRAEGARETHVRTQWRP